MRQDQYQRLQDLTEKLTDKFLAEADPDTWPGAGVALASMDAQTRGDAYWSKKNAAATLTLILKTVNLVGVIQRNSADGGGGAEVPPEQDEPDGLDGEIRAAEKEATRMLNQIQHEARKAAFDKKVHGK
ncbi:hypothetical protein [Ralstonia mannitolilytica]|uniref:hypothetical protein n=1 Tax=Ralstonia mannitolilytica TaxID=105219 RepID=UPI0007AFECB0|nr:hypothetical protein [Ralstonia mannitolilytica]ANA34475.1 hypothetical protein VZ52_14355 [Ralstonia mannitolilytica]